METETKLTYFSNPIESLPQTPAATKSSATTSVKNTPPKMQSRVRYESSPIVRKPQPLLEGTFKNLELEAPQQTKNSRLVVVIGIFIFLVIAVGLLYFWSTMLNS